MTYPPIYKLLFTSDPKQTNSIVCCLNLQPIENWSTFSLKINLYTPVFNYTEIWSLKEQTKEYCSYSIEHLKDVDFFPVFSLVGNTHLSNEEPKSMSCDLGMACCCKNSWRLWKHYFWLWLSVWMTLVLTAHFFSRYFIYCYHILQHSANRVNNNNFYFVYSIS